MKIKELKELLETFNDDWEVVLSSDGEGNSYSPLAAYCLGLYEPETTWRGEFTDSDDLENESDTNAIVLWPVN